jgi:hypothetical protein
MAPMATQSVGTVVDQAPVDRALLVDQALKEGDVVVAALEEGRQAILVRKGGLDDPGRRIPVPRGPFWLFPTLFHERGVFLKSEYHDLLVPGAHRKPREVAASLPRPGSPRRSIVPGRVRLRALGEVVDVVAARDLESLRALEDRTVWTEKYLRLRFRWRPEEHPLVLVLRVSVLPEAVEIVDRPEYGGCRSLVHLDHAIDATGAVPVWPEERLAAEVAAVRATLAAQ